MTASGKDAIRVDTEESGVVTITLDRPERMNAVDIDTLEALAEAVATESTRPGTRVLVLTGAGAAFSTGADLQAAAEAGSGAPPPERSMRAAATLVRSIVHAPIPVIAAVNGAAAGVGVSIALAADLTIMSEEAYLLFAFTSVGLMPDGGATLLLAVAIGRPMALDIVLNGRRIDAAEAREIGLVAATYPAGDFSSEVARRASRIVHSARHALRLSKQAINQSVLADLDAVLERESRGQCDLLRGPEFAEGVTAVLAGRRPDFRAVDTLRPSQCERTHQ